jgi:signal transduction histidine kinase
VAGLAAWRIAYDALDAELGRRLIAVAQSAAVLVPGDRVMRLNEGDEETRLYRNLAAKLRELKARTDVRAIRAFDADGRVRVEDERTQPIGRELVKLRFHRPELRAVAAGRGAASLLFDDADGRRYKTGYAPLRDAAGLIVGGVAVDGSAVVFARLDDLRDTLIGFGALVLLAIVVVSWAVSRRMARSVRDLVGVAEAISRGELHTRVDTAGHDEIARLARAMAEMRDAIVMRDEEMQMMLAGVAHEVRNPLGGIELYAGLLREQLGDEPRAARRVERIQNELRHLARIVEDFLHFARRIEPGRALFPAAELLHECAALVAPDATAAGVTLTVEVEGAPTLDADRDGIKRVVLNLLRNAVQACASGGRVVATCRPSADGEVLLRIEDDGSGIPEDRLKDVFKPFFTTKEKGSGLGLPLARKIVEAHGGRLDVHSRVGEGTRIDVLLRSHGEDPHR